MPNEPPSAIVESEGCAFKYWYKGSGPLLVFIPGGGGNGDQYFGIMEHMSEKFTVATYDRRQMSASQNVNGAEWKPLNPAQSSRDIIAIMKALGKQKTSIFGNSGGAVIALEFAVSYPEYLEHVIAHEAPTTALLPDSTHHLDRTFKILDLYKNSGVEAAMGEFMSEIKMDPATLNSSTRMEPRNINNWFENEFIQFTIYTPDLRRIAANKVSICVVAGEGSGDAFYARTTFEQAKIIGCPRYVFPGHHLWFAVEPKVFAEHLSNAIDDLERSRA